MALLFAIVIITCSIMSFRNTWRKSEKEKEQIRREAAAAVAGAVLGAGAAAAKVMKEHK